MPNAETTLPPLELPTLPPVEIDDLRYRRADSDDVAGVLALWDIGGWGPVTQAQFRRRWLEGPAGPALVIVIENSDQEIVGSHITDFKAARLLDHDALVRRGHALVLAPELRRSARGQREVLETDPDQQMRRIRDLYLLDAGVTTGFSIPNPRLLDRPRFGGADRNEKSYRALKLTMQDVEDYPAALEVTRVPFFHSEYDRLWERGIRGLNIECSIIRTSNWLNHLRDGDLKLECRSPRTHALVGYASAKFSDVWKLHDVFAEDEDALADVVQSVAMWFKGAVQGRDIVDSGKPTFGISAVDHPLYGGHLRALGAKETDWEFRLRINAGVVGQALGAIHDPARWYFTMGD